MRQRVYFDFKHVEFHHTGNACATSLQYIYGLIELEFYKWLGALN